MLDAIETCTSEPVVAFDDVLDVIGRRSFGPFVLVAGLIIVMPVIGDIPGIPTMVALLVLLVAGQQLAGRDQFWFPRWIRTRTVKSTRLRRGIRKLRRLARRVDRFIRPRLSAITHGRARWTAAAVTAGLALMVPMMDFIPFSANVAGAAFVLIGLGLIAHDGVVLLIGSALALVSAGIVVMALAG